MPANDTTLTNTANQLATNATATMAALQAQLDAQVARGAIPPRMRNFLMREAGDRYREQIGQIGAGLQRAREAQTGQVLREHEGAIADVVDPTLALAGVAAAPFAGPAALVVPGVIAARRVGQEAVERLMVKDDYDPENQSIVDVVGDAVAGVVFGTSAQSRRDRAINEAPDELAALTRAVEAAKAEAVEANLPAITKVFRSVASTAGTILTFGAAARAPTAIATKGLSKVVAPLLLAREGGKVAAAARVGVEAGAEGLGFLTAGTASSGAPHAEEFAIGAMFGTAGGLGRAFNLGRLKQAGITTTGLGALTYHETGDLPTAIGAAIAGGGFGLVRGRRGEAEAPVEGEVAPTGKDVRQLEAPARRQLEAPARSRRDPAVEVDIDGVAISDVALETVGGREARALRVVDAVVGDLSKKIPRSVLNRIIDMMPEAEVIGEGGEVLAPDAPRLIAAARRVKGSMPRGITQTERARAARIYTGLLFLAERLRVQGKGAEFSPTEAAEERAAIMEHDGEIPREQAEAAAYRRKEGGASPVAYPDDRASGTLKLADETFDVFFDSSVETKGAYPNGAPRRALLAIGEKAIDNAGIDPEQMVRTALGEFVATTAELEATLSETLPVWHESLKDVRPLSVAARGLRLGSEIRTVERGVERALHIKIPVGEGEFSISAWGESTERQSGTPPRPRPDAPVWEIRRNIPSPIVGFLHRWGDSELVPDATGLTKAEAARGARILAAGRGEEPQPRKARPKPPAGKPVLAAEQAARPDVNVYRRVSLEVEKNRRYLKDMGVSSLRAETEVERLLTKGALSVTGERMADTRGGMRMLLQSIALRVADEINNTPPPVTRAQIIKSIPPAAIRKDISSRIKGQQTVLDAEGVTPRRAHNEVKSLLNKDRFTKTGEKSLTNKAKGVLRRIANQVFAVARRIHTEEAGAFRPDVILDRLRVAREKQRAKRQESAKAAEKQTEAQRAALKEARETAKTKRAKETQERRGAFDRGRRAGVDIGTPAGLARGKAEIARVLNRQATVDERRSTLKQAVQEMLPKEDWGQFLSRVSPEGIKSETQLRNAADAILKHIDTLAAKAAKERLAGEIKRTGKQSSKVKGEARAILEPFVRGVRAGEVPDVSRLGELFSMGAVNFPAKLLDSVARLTGRKVKDLSIEEADLLSKTLSIARVAAIKTNNVRIGAEVRDLDATVGETIENVEKFAEPIAERLEKLGWAGKAKEWGKWFATGPGMLSAENVMLRIGGEGGVLHRLFVELHAGADKRGRHMHQIHDAINAKLAKNGHKWMGSEMHRMRRGKKAGGDFDVVEVRLDSGETMKLSREEAAHLAATAMDADGYAALTEAGFHFERDGVAQQTRRVLTDADIERIVERVASRKLDWDLTTAVMEIMGDAKNREAINDVSRRIFGYDIAKRDPYINLRRLSSKDKDLPADLREFQNTPHIEDMAPFLARTGGKDPILIDGLIGAFDRYANATSSFVGLAEPVRNARIVVGSSKVRDSIRGRHGKKTLKFLDKHLEEASLLSRADIGEVSKLGYQLQRNFVPAVLAGNLQTGFKQLPSVILAMTEMSPKYINPAAREVAAEFSKVFANLAKNRGLKGEKGGVWERPLEQSGEFWVRYNLPFSAIIGPLIGEGQSLASERGARKLMEKGMSHLRAMDRLALTTIWRAVEMEVSATRPGLKGEAYVDAVRRRTSEVVRRTQPPYSVIDMNAIQLESRSSVLVRGIMAFSTQLTQNYNVAARAGLKYSRSKRTMADRGELAESLGNVLAANPLLIAGINVGFGMLYRPSKRDEDLALAMGVDWLNNLAATIPLLGDVTKGITNYMTYGDPLVSGTPQEAVLMDAIEVGGLTVKALKDAVTDDSVSEAEIGRLIEQVLRLTFEVTGLGPAAGITYFKAYQNNVANQGGPDL